MAETGSSTLDETEVGSYFVANYPPFSVWTREAVGADARPALAAAPVAGVPLGLYLHIPFCRKRCHFCYFRVYTDKNASDVERYLDTLVREWELYLEQPAIAGRPLDFVYFGGGTPSFLSTKQLESLVGRLSALTPWTGAEEITFECEPGTLTEGKLAAIRADGRDAPQPRRRELRRPHPRDQRPRAPLARDREGLRQRARARLPADQHRPDRGHARRDRRELARRASRRRSRSSPTASPSTRWSCPSTPRSAATCSRARTTSREPVADWATKRRWVERGVRGARGAPGYTSAAPTRRSRTSRGRASSTATGSGRAPTSSGLGVASFGHVNGVHMQNLDTWEAYVAVIGRGELPLGRAYRPTRRGAR